MHDADQPAESLQASVQGPHRPSILSPWVTAVYGLFVGVYLGLAIIPASSSRLDQLDHPEDSLERLLSRDLDLLDALRPAAGWDPGWFAGALGARVAAAMGDQAIQAKAEAAIVARGEALLDRWIRLILGQLALLVLGTMVLGRVLTRRLSLVVGDAPLPPLWSQQDGLGLFVRGVFGFLLIGLATTFLLPKESLFAGISTLAAGVPMVWWTLRYFWLRGLSLPLAFGLKLRPGGAARIVGATLVIITLSVLGEVLITVGSNALHIKAHWADGLLENLLWGPSWLVTCELLDSIVWAPLIEELAFRGVLYATLRMAIGVWPAIGVSAAFFALVHGYGVIGFASVFWSGILWALAYERTRSLLPAILGHAINNLFVSVEFIWLLRV